MQWFNVVAIANGVFAIFTQEQTSAIYMRDCDLLVSAAAGSGKTAVLVERIIQMVTNIEKPIDIDRLLVVTFTEAAALEMRQRIYKAIAAKIKEKPHNEHLNRQLILLSNASIMTIHSFCLSTIRKYFYEINIDPSFRVADVTETALLKQEVLRELFEARYEQADSSSFTKLVEFYGNSIKDDALQTLVLDIYEFVQSNPNPENWLVEQAESFHFDNDEDYYNGALYKYFVKDTEKVLEAALKSIDNALLLCKNPNLHESYLKATESDKEKIAKSIDALKKGLPAFYDAVNFKFESLSGAKSKTADGTMTDEEIKILKEEIKTNREMLKSEIKKIQEKALFKPPALMLQDLRDSYPIIKELCSVVIEFSVLFSAAKRSKNIADFNDFEHLCLKVLENELIADEIRQKYEEVLIDEYQDINLVQETILKSVSRKSLGTPNRFMVGDIKQSIYRFRMANPDLFREKYNTYSKEDGSPERLINLSKNFRSRNAVLNSINFIFRRLMSDELGEVMYDENAALYFGADYYEGDSENNKTEVCLINTGADSDDAGNQSDDDDVGADLRVRPSAAGGNLPPADDETQDLLQDLTKYELEAKIVAARIKKLTENFMVTNHEGGYRKAQFSDVVILLRSQKLVADVFARELKKADIPAFAGSSSGYFEVVEIMTILSFLQVIDNPRQDIPLISTMYSPLFSFTADELVEVRRHGEGKLFYDCVVGYANDAERRGGPECPPIQQRLINFIDTLNRWRDRAVYTEISELLWEIYEETDYYNYVGALMGGNVRQANLRALFERAVQYEKTSLKGLFHFVKYIEKLQKSDTELGDAKVMSESENLVRIMSIHKSKGLEFPIVFVCGLGKKFNMQDAQKGFLMHQDLGFGSFYLDLERRIRSNTINRYAIGKMIKRESLSEELRVLYVALTRAKEKLILVGSTAKLPEENGRTTFTPTINMTTYLEWILFALAVETDNQLFNIYTKTRSEVEIAEAETADRTVDMIAKLEQIDVDADYSGMKDAIYKRLSYVYPNLSATVIPSKMSVSEIKRLYYQEIIGNSETLDSVGADLRVRLQTFAKPQFITGVMPPNQAEIGTIFHTVLEHMDFSKLKNITDIENFITELVNKNILAKEETPYININAIYKFLSSDIAKRMNRAANLSREAHFTIGVSPSEIKGEWADISEEKIIVHGIIDCFFEEDDGIVLVDYKTDNFKIDKIDAVVDKYRLQLALYKNAIEKSTGKKVIQSILYFFSQNVEKML